MSKFSDRLRNDRSYSDGFDKGFSFGVVLLLLTEAIIGFIVFISSR